MKAEYTEEDFKRGLKNPFFHKLCKIVEVAVRNEDYMIFCDIAEQNGVRPEDIINRCLIDYARMLKEHE